MNISHRKMMFYALLLVAAVTGLFIDRGQRMREAAAADEASVAVASEADATAAVDFSTIGPPMAAVFRPEHSRADLAALPEVIGRVRDAFAPSAGMEAHYRSRNEHETKKQASEEERRQQTMEENADVFRTTHVLKGTFIQPDDVWAVIDDQILRIGDALDGFTLDHVGRYRVVFKKGEVKAALVLPDPSATQVAPGKPR